MADNHGSTPAAWTAVIVIIVGFLIGSIGMVAGQAAGIYVGIGVIVLGFVLGKTLQLAGLGQRRA